MNIWIVIHIWTYEQVFICENIHNENGYKKFREKIHKCKWVSLSYEQLNIWTYEQVFICEVFHKCKWECLSVTIVKKSQSFITFIVKKITMKVITAYICEKNHNESILHESDIHASAFRNPFHCEKIHKKNRNVFHCEKNHNEKQIICKRLHCEKNHIESVFISNCWKRFHMWFFSQL